VPTEEIQLRKFIEYAGVHSWKETFGKASGSVLGPKLENFL
jgi:hypothetical protein